MVAQSLEATRTMEDMKAFDLTKRIREALEGLEKEFGEYKINDIKVGIEAGVPSGFKGSVEVTLTKK